MEELSLVGEPLIECISSEKPVYQYIGAVAVLTIRNSGNKPIVINNLIIDNVSISNLVVSGKSSRLVNTGEIVNITAYPGINLRRNVGGFIDGLLVTDKGVYRVTFAIATRMYCRSCGG